MIVLLHDISHYVLGWLGTPGVSHGFPPTLNSFDRDVVNSLPTHKRSVET